MNTIEILSPSSIEAAYLDYFNDYLTVAAFAEAYGISDHFARAVIEEGRRINNKEQAKDDAAQW